VSRVTVRCRVEVRDAGHLAALKAALVSKGIRVD